MKKESIKFIEEFDPMRKRRMLIRSQSITGIVPMNEQEAGVWFESALERDFVLLTRSNSAVQTIEEQPLRINFSQNGKARFYTPDFLIKFKDEYEQKNWLVEIKYEDELRENFSQLKPRFRAAKEYCVREGWEFKIFTEKFIRIPLLENINFLSRYNHNDVDRGCYQYVLSTLRDLGNTTPEEFMLTVKSADHNLRGRFLYALWYAIKREHIGCNLAREVLSMETQIWVNNEEL